MQSLLERTLLSFCLASVIASCSSLPKDVVELQEALKACNAKSERLEKDIATAEDLLIRCNELIDG